MQHFLECVERFLPSREEYKRHNTEETSKQKRRRLELKKEKNRGRKEKART